MGATSSSLGVESDNTFVNENFSYIITDPTQFDPGTPSPFSFLSAGLVLHCPYDRVFQTPSTDTASAGSRAHFLSSTGQFVSNVMDVDLVWSVVWTTNCLASGLTS